MDPLGSHPLNIPNSTYCFANNNPILYIDKGGKIFQFPAALVAAAGGFVADAGAQFVSGLLSGKSMKESFRNIDWADAAVTAGEAALATVTVGASLVVTRVAASTIRSSVDLSWNEQKIVFGSGEHKKTLNEFATDMISEGFGALAGKLGDNLVDPLIEKAVNNFVRPFFRSSTKKVSRKIYDYTSNFVTNMYYDRNYVLGLD